MSGFFTVSLSIAGDPFSVAITPEVTGISTSAPVTTDIASVVVTGGVGPFLYSWSFVGDPQVVILASTAPGTAFRSSPVVGEPKTGLAYCLVTDGTTGASVRSTGCAVTMTRI